MTTFVVLHPGQMGASIAAAAVAGGNDVLWVDEGRSGSTVARAESAGLTAVPSLDEAMGRADVVVSVCPPASSVDVATAVASTGFAGRYLDANAVAPDTAEKVRTVVSAAGASAIDGGIIGPPAWSEGSTRMYVSGDGAGSIAEAFAGSLLGVVALDLPYGAASALKMAYAGWTKGSSALLLSIAAFAEAAGVGEALRSEWAISQPGVAERAERAAGGTGPKAWRFVGEMHEIASSLSAAGVPDGFHRGAAEVYERMAGFKDATTPPSIDDVIAAIVASQPD